MATNPYEPPKVDPSAPNDNSIVLRSTYERVIVRWSVVGGCLAAGLLIAMLIALGTRALNFNVIGMCGIVVGGAIFGAAAACAFAPQSFFEGAEGKKWLARIGIERVPAARAVCLLFMLFVTLFVGFLAWAVLKELNQKS